MSFSDLPAKFHVLERFGSLRNEPRVTAIDAFLAVFEIFMNLIRNLAIKPVLFIIENESPKLCRTYRENRMSKSCFVLKISRAAAYSSLL